MLVPRGETSEIETHRLDALTTTDLAEDGRHDIDVTGESLRHTPGRFERPLHDERNVRDLVVERDAVLSVSVLVPGLAVVGGHDDERVLIELPALQLVEEPAELVVHVGDLRVVELPELVPLCFCGRPTARPRPPRVLPYPGGRFSLR